MKFEGIIPALITPLTEDEQINVPVLHKLVDFLLEQGANGLYIGGATGEGPALQQPVREVLAE
ncbi:MAG: dihydrodipicolinate synthase family protein, partial [Clostridia bacterium]|nr:dihydrodipicolinate synthase family protein [Clostridia bacterium]